MSFGTSAETFAYTLIFGLGLLASFSVAMLFVALIQRFLGSKAGGFGMILVALIYLGGLLGASFYLDSAGTLVEAVVAKKNDRIEFRRQGDWQHHFDVEVGYQTPEGEETSSLFRTSEAYFDSLREGGQVPVRRVSINGWFDLARFADQSTSTWIPWRWIAIGLAVVGLGWLSWKLFNPKLIALLIGMTLFVLAITPLMLKYFEWRHSEDASRTPFQTTGTVEEVIRVTTIDPIPPRAGGRSRRRWNTKLEVPQLYDIYVVRYTPQGYQESILGVDAIDADESPLTAGMSVELAYSPDAPRTIRLPNRTRSHFIRNPIAWAMQELFMPVLIIGGLLLFGLSRRLRNRN